MTPQTTYGDVVSRRMQDATRNTQGRELTIRDLEQGVVSLDGTRWVYEQFRKVIRGMPVMSQQLNAALCAFLGLCSDRMWQIAITEKGQWRARELRAHKVRTASPDERLTRAWENLSTADQKRSIQFMDALALRS